MMHRRILVVEDDRAMAMVLVDNLKIDGFDVRWVADSREAVAACGRFQPDLVLLDLMLGATSGYDLCGALRQSGRAVIIVSARSQGADKIRGLQLGADDYVTKPFDMEELVARINAVLRRAAPTVERIVLGDVTIDFVNLQAKKGTQQLHLTHREFEILQYLATHRGTVHRDQLLSDIWGVLDGSTTRSVDFAIVRLRKKIEADPHNPQFVRTVHGDGYCLACD